MDCFSKDMQHAKKRIIESLDLGNLSRGKDLDKLEKIAGIHHLNIALYHPNNLHPFFVCSHFFRYLGKKKGACAYVTADFYPALMKGGNWGVHTHFIGHFSHSTADEYRHCYKFITTRGNVCWVTACSCLINPGKGNEPFILSLIFSNEKNRGSNKDLLHDLSLGFNMHDLEAKINRLTGREREVLEIVAFGVKNQEGSEELLMGKSTFETYKKYLKQLLGVSTDAGLSRIFYSYKHSKASEHP